jgi:hypothetical protein
VDAVKNTMPVRSVTMQAPADFRGVITGAPSGSFYQVPAPGGSISADTRDIALLTQMGFAVVAGPISG